MSFVREDGSKSCPKCHVDFPDAEKAFWHNKNTRDGYASQCMKCLRAYNIVRQEEERRKSNYLRFSKRKH